MSHKVFIFLNITQVRKMSNISAISWRGQATVQVETWYDRCPTSDHRGLLRFLICFPPSTVFRVLGKQNRNKPMWSDVSDLTRQTLGLDRTEPGNKIPV
jgi:hypothetical protein